MTTLTKKPLYDSPSASTGGGTTFVKLGAFDPDNYKPSELKKNQENEEKYKPIRLQAGDKLQGAIAEVKPSKFGDILQLVDVTITRSNKKHVSEKDTESEVQLGVTVDIKNKLSFTKKSIGDIITLEYLGKHASPKNPTQMLHKVNIV